MLWTVFALLIILWGWGFVTQIAGGMIHLLLVAAAAVGLMKILLSGRQGII
ncbi:MAG TPA: lmo0937 family membrane protein [Methylomirabilota bacterium]|nr:lmo0937 family membrane protein [Methylomirabilota bacterium]